MRIGASILIMLAVCAASLSTAFGQARPTLTVALGHPDAFVVSAFSPDEKWLATVADRVEVRVWETGSGLLYRTLALPAGMTLATAMPNPMMAMPQAQAPPVRAALSFDNRYLAVALKAQDASVRLMGWDLQTGKTAFDFKPVTDDPMNPAIMEVYAIAFLPDGATLVAQSMNGLHYFTFATGKWLSSYGPKENTMIQSLAVSPDGRFLAAQFQGADPANPQIPQGCRLWDAKTGKVLYSLDGTRFMPGTLHYSADCSQILSTNLMNGQTSVADTATGKIYAPVTYAARPAGSEVLLPHHSFFGVFTAEKVSFYRAADAEPFLNLTDHRGAVQGALASPNGAYLAYNTLTAGGEPGLYLVNLAEQKRLWKREARNPAIGRMFFAPNGKMLAVTGPSLHIQLVNLVSGAVGKRFTGPAYDYTAAAFSPDGKLTAFAGPDYADLLVLDAATGAEKYRLPIGKQTMLRLQFTADSQYLLLGSSLKGVNGLQLLTRAFTMADGKPAWQQNAWMLDASPDGTVVAVFVPRQAGVRLLNAATGAIVTQLTANTVCDKAAFSSFDPTVAGTGGRNYLLWQLPATKPTGSGRLDANITVTALSPKAAQAAFGCDDGSVTLATTDPKSGVVNRALAGRGVTLTALAYSPKGDLLASGDLDGHVLLWDVAKGTLLADWQLFPVAKDGMTELNWLVTTPDGFMHCAETTKPLLGWCTGDKLAPFGEFEQTYLNPDKVREALKR